MVLVAKLGLRLTLPALITGNNTLMLIASEYLITLWGSWQMFNIYTLGENIAKTFKSLKT